MDFDILTLIPEFFVSPLEQSILGRAAREGSIRVKTHNIRDFATDKHNSVDDTPYGGGAGMVMMPGPIVDSVEAVKGEGAKALVVLMTPQGTPLTQTLAQELKEEERLIIVCGRYEGVDERVRDFVDLEISVGDYVLNGGESAALVLIETVSRLVPGVIEEESTELDSFSDGLLEYPHYTKPRDFRGKEVPEVLLSGDHEKKRLIYKRNFGGFKMGVIQDLEKKYLRTDLPDFRSGDTITVNVRIKEGNKERIQAFEGAVIRRRGGGVGATFTVRKVSYGVGVERVFSLNSPLIESIKLVTKGRSRRARLYFLRELKGKAAKQALRVRN
jgi:tRNA (guanine37-N1)-methyltransferase